jgi:FAD synthetase
MSLKVLASKYIISAEKVLGEIEVVRASTSLDSSVVSKVVEHAKAYLEDARYYKSEGRFEVSLASVAYCEGLLDALRLVGAVRFEWPTRPKDSRDGK